MGGGTRLAVVRPARRSELHSELDQALTDLLLARRDEIRHPDPSLAIAFVLDQTGSMLKTRLDGTLMPTRLASQSDEAFVQETMRSACAYLEVELPG